MFDSILARKDSSIHCLLLICHLIFNHKVLNFDTQEKDNSSIIILSLILDYL